MLHILKSGLHSLDVSEDDLPEYIKTHNYFDYLTQTLGVDDPQVLHMARHSAIDWSDASAELLTIKKAKEAGALGFAPVKVYDADHPYIHHFPDGNAGVARAIVKYLIPSIAEGATAESLVGAKFDYGQLDGSNHPSRLRLNSTVVDVHHSPDKAGTERVSVHYIQGEKAHKISADHVVMACNTSCALARPAAEQVVRKGKREILLDLIEPTAAYLLEIAQKSGPHDKIKINVGVMSTINTARSGAFGKALRKSPDIFKGQVKELGCPKLVPLIESGRLQDPDIASALDEALVEYLEQLAGTTHLILGCTHYPFIEQQILDLARGRLAHLFADGLVTVDPAVALAAQMTGQTYKDIHAIKAQVDYSAPAFTICTTGDTNAFDLAAALCLSCRKIKSRHVSLGHLAPKPATNALAFPITLL